MLRWFYKYFESFVYLFLYCNDPKLMLISSKAEFETENVLPSILSAIYTDWIYVAGAQGSLQLLRLRLVFLSLPPGRGTRVTVDALRPAVTGCCESATELREGRSHTHD